MKSSGMAYLLWFLCLIGLATLLLAVAFPAAGSLAVGASPGREVARP